ncbi:SAC3/GANP/Nin1/mts3/eIF-3 p25 family-domain-containing protein [Hypoxylon cercidicola]|nr:SAC3/GANP/Nin1/mts3/eIF-3 p25 family-domain-containing protein [Hypoxylon cercidicola]
MNGNTMDILRLRKVIAPENKNTGAATKAQSSSHMWQRAPKPLSEQSGSRFSFVSLSAYSCLPCLRTKSTKSTEPNPPAIRRIVKEASSTSLNQPRSRNFSEPGLTKPPERPPSPLTETKPSPDVNEAAGIVATTPASPSSPIPTTHPSAAADMAEQALQQILSKLRSNPGLPYADASAQLKKAKIALLSLKAATPGPGAPAAHLALARDVYEQGALCSIRARQPDAFTRYVAQLQPYYELPPAALRPTAERNKVTGLYLLLLLTQGRYAEFHSELETLATRAQQDASAAGAEIETDRFLGYPIKLERWLMEGSYDRVWKAMKSREVPSEEYGVFSEILTSQIRSEIASSSERAYPSLPLSSTKSLLFLDSEGAVVDFARQRGWAVRDGHIYFPASASALDDGEEMVLDDAGDDEQEFSRMVIENALGYARELETIV